MAVNFTDDERLKILDACCKDIIEDAEIGVFLEEGKLENGQLINVVSLGERLVQSGFQKVETYFNSTNDFVTMVIRFNNKNSVDKSSIYSLWDLYRKKSNDNFMKNSDKLCNLFIGFSKKDQTHGLCTLVDVTNPIAMFKDDNEGYLELLVHKATFHYSIKNLNYSDIEAEIEYEVAEDVRLAKEEIRKEEERKAYAEEVKRISGVDDFF